MSAKYRPLAYLPPASRSSTLPWDAGGRVTAAPLGWLSGRTASRLPRNSRPHRAVFHPRARLARNQLPAPSRPPAGHRCRDFPPCRILPGRRFCPERAMVSGSRWLGSPCLGSPCLVSWWLVSPWLVSRSPTNHCLAACPVGRRLRTQIGRPTSARPNPTLAPRNHTWEEESISARSRPRPTARTRRPAAPRIRFPRPRSLPSPTTRVCPVESPYCPACSRRSSLPTAAGLPKHQLPRFRNPEP